MTLLRLKAISKMYEGKNVLSSISLNVDAGEWVGIVGESGSGKTTLLSIISRFLDTDEGAVYFQGKLMKPIREQLMKGHEQIKVVKQDFALFPNQTTSENIGYALRFYEPAYREQRVNDLLRLTRLVGVKDHKAKLLSGGEKQRTALANVLAEVPSLLLLDEPFAHLDQLNKQKLSEAIEELRRTHKITCVFVTHDASEAMSWADRLVILKEGKIVQEGTPEEVYQHPKDTYVAQLTGQVNLFKLPGANEVRMIRPNHLRIIKEEKRALWKIKIMRIRFKGMYYEYFGSTETGEILHFYQTRREKAIGDIVYLTCAKKHMHRLTIESNQQP